MAICTAVRGLEDADRAVDHAPPVLQTTFDSVPFGRQRDAPGDRTDQGSW